MFTLITDYSAFGSGKTHIAKERHTVKSMCGRRLGFNFSPVSVDGSEGGENLLVTKEYVLSLKSVCKKCLLSIKKETPIQIEVGEWIYKGCFIQQNEHPAFKKFIVFENTELQSHIGFANSFKYAKKLCYDVENKKHSVEDLIGL